MTQTKHLWIVPLVIAGIVGFVGWWANFEVRQTIQQDIRGDLMTTLDANVTALEIWLGNQKRIVSSIAEEPRLKAIALELLERAESVPANRNAPAETMRQAFGWRSPG